VRPLIPGQIEGKCAAVEVDYITGLLPQHLFKSHFIMLNRVVAVIQRGGGLGASYSKSVNPRPEFALH